MKIVLQKYIAEAGYFSRRQAEELIKNGRVEVNGLPAELGMRADDNDEIVINGKKLGLAKQKIYIKLNKPVGYVCTNRPFKGEKNIFSLIKTRQRLFTVGRLDKNSRGLVLLTNDGNLAQKLAHPKFEHEKEYEVRIKNNFNSHGLPRLKIKEVEKIIKNLRSGVDIGGGDGVVRIKRAEYSDENRFKIILTQGKKRQIRRMLTKLGYEIEDLLRIRISSLKLEKLLEGEWKYLNEAEVNNLKRGKK